VQLRILVVDDNPSIRHSLCSFLELNPQWEICGETADGLEAVRSAADLHPDVIIMDLEMPRLNGLEATRRIHGLSPAARVLILTLHENAILSKIAQDSGAQGYVLKTEPLEVLTRAIETVGNSDRFFVSSPH
jgi:DNA-binding NarL/FixJ family response regulator